MTRKHAEVILTSTEPVNALDTMECVLCPSTSAIVRLQRDYEYVRMCSVCMVEIVGSYARQMGLTLKPNGEV